MLYQQQKYTKLEQSHYEYQDYLPDWLELEELIKGGRFTKKNADHYLLVRDDEDPKIREKRKEKFLHRNHLGSAIRLQRTKLATGSIEYPAEEVLPGDIDRWNAFLSNSNGQGLDFKTLLLDAFEEAVGCQTLFAFIDLPPVPLQGQNVRQQELARSALLQKGVKDLPYVSLLHPKQVLNWGEDIHGITWIKYKVILRETHPLEPDTTTVLWVIIDKTHITVFGLEDVKVNDKGEVTDIRDGNDKEGNPKYKTFNKEKAVVNVIRSQSHNRGDIPVVRLHIPYSLWTANQAAQAQKLIIGLETNRLHTTCNSGFVQKWLEPYFQQGSSAVQIPNELLKKVMEEVGKAQGDESTIAVKSYNFAEMEGKSITTQGAVIEELSQYIYSVISLNVASVTKETLEQSGRSKEFDMYLAEQSLLGYGELIIQFGQQILRHVARAMGIQSPEELELLELRGLNSFKIDSLDLGIERWERVAKIDPTPLPDSVKKLIIRGVASPASINATDEEVDTINQDISNFKSPAPEPVTPLNTRSRSDQTL